MSTKALSRAIPEEDKSLLAGNFVRRRDDRARARERAAEGCERARRRAGKQKACLQAILSDDGMIGFF